MANALIVVFTGIIALATLAYVFFSFRLWKTTQTAAGAAKKSADMAAGVHRPYLGVSVLQRHNDYNQDIWAIRWCVKNYGTLPASEVRVGVVLDRQGRGDYGGGPVCSGCEVLPQAELTGFIEIRVDRHIRDQISSGEAMIAHVEIEYVAPGGAHYTHSAEFAFDRTTQNFRPERSETKADRD